MKSRHDIEHWLGVDFRKFPFLLVNHHLVVDIWMWTLGYVNPFSTIWSECLHFWDHFVPKGFYEDLYGSECMFYPWIYHKSTDQLELFSIFECLPSRIFCTLPPPLVISNVNFKPRLFASGHSILKALQLVISLNWNYLKREHMSVINHSHVLSTNEVNEGRTIEVFPKRTRMIGYDTCWAMSVAQLQGL